MGDLGEVKPSPELQQEIRAYRIRMAMTGGSRPNLTEAEKKVESEELDLLRRLIKKNKFL